MAFKTGSVFTISFKWWGVFTYYTKIYYPDDAGDAYDAWEWDNYAQIGTIPAAGTIYDEASNPYTSNAIGAHLAGQFVAPVNCRLVAMSNVYDFSNPSNGFTTLRMGAFKVVFDEGAATGDFDNWTSLGYIDSTTQTGDPGGYVDSATALFNTTNQDVAATDTVGFTLSPAGASGGTVYGCTTAVFRIT